MPEEPVAGHGRDDDPPAAPRGPVPASGASRLGVAARAAGGYAAFEQGCALDGEIASAVMSVVLDELAGPDRRPVAASDDAVLGMLGGADKMAAWCESLKLGLIRELIARNPHPATRGTGAGGTGEMGSAAGAGGTSAAGLAAGGTGPGGLPAAWAQGLAQQIAAELAVSHRTADTLLSTAHALARLPQTAAALDRGIISGHKAQIIAEATGPLTDEQAAEADRRAAPKLAGTTPGQIRDIIRRAVIAVDPDGARRRREQAQREHARVEFWQDAVNGTANLAGFALPADEGLMCNQRIQDRALAYKQARTFPGMSMDLLRIRAYIDLLLGRDGRDTIPAGPADGGYRPADDGGHGAGGGASDAIDAATGGPGGSHGKDADGDQGTGSGHDENADTDARDSGGHRTDANEEGGNGNGGQGTGGNDPADGSAPAGGAAAGTGTGSGLAANVNLTVTLATLLGLAERPGHLAGLGATDPALARDLATAAAASGRSTWCITVTNDQGHAIGHGCARPNRSDRTRRSNRYKSSTGGARTRDGPAFTQQDQQGPRGGYGTWTLTLPTGGQYTVQLGPIPLTECDHRYETAGYQPSRLLRHLVQIRDGTCTFPPCRRPAKQCDFEHATPYHRGGRTDLCNCGPRCRCDHQVKQREGWSVTQTLPGWHEWRTPSGRRYVNGPTEHPI